MKRSQILTQIEQNADELALLYNKQTQAQTAYNTIAADLELLGMKRAQLLDQLAAVPENVSLLKMKRSQILTQIEQNTDELALLSNKQAQAQSAYDKISEDLKLLELKRNQTAVKIAQNKTEITLLQMKLAEAESNLADTRLFASISGIISSVNANEKDSIGTQAAVVRIVDLEKMRAVVELDEIDMADIKTGQTINLEFDSLPDQDIAAYISSIAVEGRYTSQGIGVVDVEITIENPPEGLKPGYTFAGGILVSDSEEILAVAEEAVFALPVGDMSIIMKKGEDDTPIPVRVTTEPLPDGMVRILSGDLKAGDIVVLAEMESTGENGAGAAGFSLPGMRIPGSGGGAGGGFTGTPGGNR